MAGKKQKAGNSSQTDPSAPKPKKKLPDAMHGYKFAPGVSGNPSGRPKSVFRAAFLKVLDKQIPNDKEGRTYLDILAEKIVAEAAKGKIDALRELADRVDGKPVQALTHGGEGGGPIPIEVMTADQRKVRLQELLAKASSGAKVRHGKGSAK